MELEFPFFLTFIGKYQPELCPRIDPELVGYPGFANILPERGNPVAKLHGLIRGTTNSNGNVDHYG